MDCNGEGDATANKIPDWLRAPSGDRVKKKQGPRIDRVGWSRVDI